MRRTYVWGKLAFNEALTDLFARPQPLTKPLRLFKGWAGSGKRILDVGCGSGFYAELFQSWGNEVVGLDITREGVVATRRRGVQAMLCDVETPLPLSSASFDMVLCLELFEHLLQPELALSEAHRVLKEGGTLILTTPNYAYWSLRLLYLWGIPPVGLERYYTDRDVPPWREPHIRFFTPGSLRDFLELGGFKVVEMRASHVAFPSGLAIYLPWLLGLPLRVMGKLCGNLELMGDLWPSLLAAGLLMRATKG